MKKKNKYLLYEVVFSIVFVSYLAIVIWGFKNQDLDISISLATLLFSGMALVYTIYQGALSRDASQQSLKESSELHKASLKNDLVKDKLKDAIKDLQELLTELHSINQKLQYISTTTILSSDKNKVDYLITNIKETTEAIQYLCTVKIKLTSSMYSIDEFPEMNTLLTDLKETLVSSVILNLKVEEQKVHDLLMQGNYDIRCESIPCVSKDFFDSIINIITDLYKKLHNLDSYSTPTLEDQ